MCLLIPSDVVWNSLCRHSPLRLMIPSDVIWSSLCHHSPVCLLIPNDVIWNSRCHHSPLRLSIVSDVIWNCLCGHFPLLISSDVVWKKSLPSMQNFPARYDTCVCEMLRTLTSVTFKKKKCSSSCRVDHGYRQSLTSTTYKCTKI